MIGGHPFQKQQGTNYVLGAEQRTKYRNPSLQSNKIGIWTIRKILLRFVQENKHRGFFWEDNALCQRLNCTSNLYVNKPKTKWGRHLTSKIFASKCRMLRAYQRVRKVLQLLPKLPELRIQAAILLRPHRELCVHRQELGPGLQQLLRPRGVCMCVHA